MTGPRVVPADPPPVVLAVPEALADSFRVYVAGPPVCGTNFVAGGVADVPMAEPAGAPS